MRGATHANHPRHACHVDTRSRDELESRGIFFLSDTCLAFR